MRIAIASPPLPQSIAHALDHAERLIKEAISNQADLVCFPESYIPGYPLKMEIQNHTSEELQLALQQISNLAKQYSIAIIMPMNWYEDGKFYNVAHVISASGELLGHQTKNQLDPTEDHKWIPGESRALFEIKGIKFGIVICHEGFRYPESVRWAAQRGATIVFHPHCAGSDESGPILTEWGHKENPYYEKAMMMRALENTIYFASANYSFRYPDSASAIIAPDGSCIAHESYGNAGIIVADIDQQVATGLLAKRFKKDLYS